MCRRTQTTCGMAEGVERVKRSDSEDLDTMIELVDAKVDWHYVEL